MAQHRYQLYCALARTLDVAGDRWTLLIVREPPLARGGSPT
jgi:DNA-binding HxlR family transcriptional regulator